MFWGHKELGDQSERIFDSRREERTLPGFNCVYRTRRDPQTDALDLWSNLMSIASMRTAFTFAMVALLAFCGPLSADLVITEIHYAPTDPDGTPRPDLELVEIFNDGPEPYDLLGYRFTDGLSYTFGREIINGRSYIVVAKDPDAVRDEYGIANVVGPFEGILDNSGEDIDLSNPQGRIVSSVNYNDRGLWPAGAKGTGHSLSLKYEYTDPSEPENWALSAQRGGSPGVSNFGTAVNFVDTTIIAVGETWRYLKGTSEPSSSWKNTSFNDGSWLTGATGIGYGDGDDATQLNDMQNNYVSVYCRKSFNLSSVDDIDDLVLSIGYDDGFVFYLNGSEVASRNVSASARDFDDTATGTVSDADFEDINLNAFKNLLQVGNNVVAAQVHNTSSGSSDLSFIPSLVSRRSVNPGETETVPVVINEGFFRTGGGRFVELYNKSTSAVDLSGFHLTDEFSNLTKFIIPNSTTIAGRSFLSFSESALGFDLSIDPLTKPRVSIALVNSAGTRVVDAVIFEPAVDERSEARIPDGGRRFQPAATATSGAANVTPVEDRLVINEIMYNPITDPQPDEWIEFYNKGPGSVDMSGWTVEGIGLFTFPPGTVVDEDDYLVIAQDERNFGGKYGNLGGRFLAGDWLGSLRDSGERLALYDEDGNEVDSVRFHDGGDWTKWADGNGSSLELIDPDSDNSIAMSWDASDDSHKAAPQTFTIGGLPYGGRESDLGILLNDEGICIVDDISLVRTGSGANLVNNGTFNSGTSPWRIEGTHIRSGRTTDPDEVINGGGSLKIVCWNGGGDYKVNRIEQNTGSQTSGTYTVRYTAKWVVGSNRFLTIGDYSTGQPHNPGLASSRALTVPRDLGTPGAINSVTARQIQQTGTDNVGPAITDVRHSPGVPETNETVTVFARAVDPSGVNSMTIRYRTETPAGAFSSRTMTDPDGDGIFSGTIPGQANGIRVVFFIEAVDNQGAPSRFPVDLMSRTHPPVVNPSSPGVNDHHYLVYRHDTRNVSTNRHSYRFVLNEAAENELFTRRALSNQMMRGTFVFGSGDVYYGSLVRFAGSPWLRGGNRDWNKSYSLKTPKDNELHGRKFAFNLDEHGSDGRERLTHYLLRQSAGTSTALPYFDFHSLVRFQLNDVHTGTKEALDKPNSHYMGFWFDGDLGPFFEMDDRFQFNDSGSGHAGNAESHVLYPPYGSSAGGSNKENYRWYFAPRGGKNKSKDDFQPLMQFCQFMDDRQTSSGIFDASVFSLVDVDELLRVFAIELNIDDWDTWVGRRGKNGYLYRSTADALWRKVPWDLELTYGNVNAFGMPASITQTYGNHFRELTRFLNRPIVERRYYGILAEQVDTSTGFFHSGFLQTFTSRLSSAGVGSMGNAGSGGFIDQRANLIRNWVRGAVFPQVRLTITTNGGNDFVATAPTVNLQGNAPADVFHLSVIRNGTAIDHDVRFVTNNHTGWTATNIPLAGGANALQIVGFSSKGDIVDFDQIEVTSPVDWEPPVIASVVPNAAASGDTVVITGEEFHNNLSIFIGSALEADSVVFDEDSDPNTIEFVVPTAAVAGLTTVEVENIDGKRSDAVLFTVLPPAPKFIRGDSTMDRRLEVSDGLKTLLYLYNDLPVDCLDALDSDDSGSINVNDAMIVLNHIFLNGTAPLAPYPNQGSDPTNDDVLDCNEGLPQS